LLKATVFVDGASVGIRCKERGVSELAALRMALRVLVHAGAKVEDIYIYFDSSFFRRKYFAVEREFDLIERLLESHGEHWRKIEDGVKADAPLLAALATKPFSFVLSSDDFKIKEGEDYTQLKVPGFAKRKLWFRVWNGEFQIGFPGHALQPIGLTVDLLEVHERDQIPLPKTVSHEDYEMLRRRVAEQEHALEHARRREREQDRLRGETRAQAEREAKRRAEDERAAEHERAAEADRKRRAADERQARVRRDTHSRAEAPPISHDSRLGLLMGAIGFAAAVFSVIVALVLVVRCAMDAEGSEDPYTWQVGEEPQTNTPARWVQPVESLDLDFGPSSVPPLTTAYVVQLSSHRYVDEARALLERARREGFEGALIQKTPVVCVVLEGGPTMSHARTAAAKASFLTGKSPQPHEFELWCDAPRAVGDLHVCRPYVLWARTYDAPKPAIATAARLEAEGIPARVVKHDRMFKVLAGLYENVDAARADEPRILSIVGGESTAVWRPMRECRNPRVGRGYEICGK
jgi:hypothetical protein